MKESKWSATCIRAVSLLLLIGALSNDSRSSEGAVANNGVHRAALKLVSALPTSTLPQSLLPGLFKR